MILIVIGICILCTFIQFIYTYYVFLSPVGLADERKITAGCSIDGALPPAVRLGKVQQGNDCSLTFTRCHCTDNRCNSRSTSYHRTSYDCNCRFICKCPCNENSAASETLKICRRFYKTVLSEK